MIVDFDDFCEAEHRLDLLHDLHEANPAFRVTLFAIPGLGSETFWQSVPDWCELAVHGWLHPTPRECEHWTYARMAQAIRHKPPRFVEGFKAPGWQISDGCYDALQQAGWWCADHYENDQRRPEGLRTHVLNQGEHWHGHIPNVCGNGIEETWDELLERVTQAESFQLISEVASPWHARQ